MCTECELARGSIGSAAERGPRCLLTACTLSALFLQRRFSSKEYGQRTNTQDNVQGLGRHGGDMTVTHHQMPFLAASRAQLQWYRVIFADEPGNSHLPSAPL